MSSDLFKVKMLLGFKKVTELRVILIVIFKVVMVLLREVSARITTSQLQAKTAFENCLHQNNSEGLRETLKYCHSNARELSDHPQKQINKNKKCAAQF